MKDANGNPTLLVPNIDPTRTDKRRSLDRVEYDRTASHLHHAPEMGIQLPKNFNLETTPSADSLLDSTKCYGHREAYDMPREVTERFEASAVSKLAKNSLKDPLLKKEYARVKKSMKEGIHPINVGYNSAFVSSDKLLIKCSKGQYLVEVGDTKVDILGVVARRSDKSVKSFEKLMNKMYNLDLQY